MTEPASSPSPKPQAQRTYQALCPNCGAPVAFFSAASTHAVCGYCQSTVVRDGDTLTKVGEQSALFDDHSPLQLMATGQWAEAGATKPTPFTLIGRTQYRYGEGVWNEWQAWLDDGRAASLSEDNGGYVMSLPLAGDALTQAQQALRMLGEPNSLRLGQVLRVQGATFTLASVQQATVQAAQGEFPAAPPRQGDGLWVSEWRSPQGAVLSAEVDTQGATAAWADARVSVGRTVSLADLQLKGLRDDAPQLDIKDSRAFSCPNCGSPVQPMLPETKSITCGSCHSLIDLSQGVGGELRHAVQHEPMRPTIAVGTVGQLQGKDWQVVGFQHRMGWEDGDDERFGWSEYLLYNRAVGFQFLVESTEGWSLVQPLTGAPQQAGGYVKHNQRTYTLDSRYTAETDFVLGEFYWRVERGQRTRNADYKSGDFLLSSEASQGGTGQEQVWSGGSRLRDEVVAKAFGLTRDASRGLQPPGGSAALTPRAGMSLAGIILVIVVILIFITLVRACDDCDPRTQNCSSSSSGSTGVYTSGGSSTRGGYSSGGGHK